jgi:hypothetical protein
VLLPLIYLVAMNPGAALLLHRPLIYYNQVYLQRQLKVRKKSSWVHHLRMHADNCEQLLAAAAAAAVQAGALTSLLLPCTWQQHNCQLLDSSFHSGMIA